MNYYWVIVVLNADGTIRKASRFYKHMFAEMTRDAWREAGYDTIFAYYGVELEN